jgi:putative ABC transport system substrate-binding protein
MKRREFIAVLGAAVSARPFSAWAQQGAVRRIAVLVTLAADDPEMRRRLAVFRQELEKLGWTDGRNAHIDVRYAFPISLGPGLAKELVALQPDVILAQGTPLVAALQRETHKVPIVFVGAYDPIGSGFVTSLARPGSNLTGTALYDASVSGKWIGMLKEIAPGLARVAVLGDPKITSDYWSRAAEVVAAQFNIKIIPSPAENATDIKQAIETFAREPNGGLLVPPDPSMLANRDLIIGLAATYRLPAVYNDSHFVIAGGLMSYGSYIVDLFQVAASYVDRILRGANPADLPVQVPTRYQTVLNLKTAKALGVTVTDKLLVAADEVIE